MQALEDMLKQILAMDEKARRYTDETESKKEERRAALQKEREQLLAQKLRQAEQQAKVAKEPMLEKARQSKEQLRISGEEAEEKLLRSARKNEANWVREITERVLRQD